MYSGVEIKPDNVLASGAPICYACLSSDRKLYPLGEYSSLFFKLFDINFRIEQTAISLCWECTAMLRKVQLFKEKVDHAQVLLNIFYHSQKNTTLESLSTLTSTTTATSTYLQETSLETEETVLHSKPEVIVKTEAQDEENMPMAVDDYEEPFDCEPNDYVNLEDIKTEDTKLILKIKNFKDLLTDSTITKEREHCVQKKNKRRYIRVAPDKKATSEIVSICCSEASYWMALDRQSEYFKKLKHKCSKCVMKVYNKDYQNKHRWDCHAQTANRKYTCDICKSTFQWKTSLSNHMKLHCILNICKLCGFRCYSKDHMKHHLLQHEKTVQCRECLHVLPTISDFSRHYQDLHRQYRCHHCSKTTSSKRVIERHMIRNHLPIVCKECNINFKNYPNYHNHCNLKHVKQMTEEAFCVPCNRQFSNPQEYRNHINSAVAHRKELSRAVKREKVPCPECPKTYAKRYSMLNHWRFVHQKESRYTCQQCGLQLLNRTKLVEHVKFKHEGAVREKNQLCNICGRGFATRRILRHHVRTHTGERPYKCMHCGAKFAQQYAMQTHVKFVHLKARRRRRQTSAYGVGEFAEFTEGQ